MKFLFPFAREKKTFTHDASTCQACLADFRSWKYVDFPKDSKDIKTEFFYNNGHSRTKNASLINFLSWTKGKVP